MTEIEVVGYHGTKKEYALNILQNGFRCEIYSFTQKEKKRLPNDLGSGVYVFLDESEFEFDGQKCAINYTVTFKNNSTDFFTILEVPLKIKKDKHKILNLDNPEVQKVYVKARKGLEQVANKYLKENIKDDGSLKRGQLDGLFLEMMLNTRKFELPSIVMKKTYTPYNDSKLSGFPNGLEMAIRDVEIIGDVTKITDIKNIKNR